MPRSTHRLLRGRTLRIAGMLIIGLGALAGVMLAAMASASSFTLRVQKKVHVTNEPTKAFRVKPVDRHEAVAVGPTGYAVYTFQGETTHHLICQKTSSAATNCWAFWPPVVARSGRGLSKPAGISGKLGTFRNQGTLQLTLNGQPLYYFTPDLKSHDKRQATGDELKTFGSIWHVVVAGPQVARAPVSPAPAAPSSTTSTPYQY